MQFRVHADSKIPVLRGRANKNELIKRPDPERRGGETSPVDTQCRVSCVPPVCICIRIRTEDAIFSSPPPLPSVECIFRRSQAEQFRTNGHDYRLLGNFTAQTRSAPRGFVDGCSRITEFEVRLCS